MPIATAVVKNRDSVSDALTLALGGIYPDGGALMHST